MCVCVCECSALKRNTYTTATTCQKIIYTHTLYIALTPHVTLRFACAVFVAHKRNREDETRNEIVYLYMPKGLCKCGVVLEQST